MANLVLSTTTNPGTASWVDVTTISGTTIVPDGGSIAGTYEGNVICLGGVYITADIVVYGDLIVKGNVYAPTPVEITVHGDFLVGPVTGSLTGRIYIVNGTITVDTILGVVTYTTTGLTPQKNITVGGDFNFDLMEFPQTGGSASLITVAGDLHAGFMYAQSIDDIPNSNFAPGASVEIGGNGDGSLYLRGTPGGAVSVFGNWVGNIDTIGISRNGITGNGGNVLIQGNASFTSGCAMSGGDSDNLPGGFGGSLTVYGNCNADNYIRTNGGFCESPNPEHTSGGGGSVSVSGNLVCVYLNTYAGYRAGALTGTAGIILSASAGYVYAGGSLHVFAANCTGGDVYNTGTDKSQTGGNGASISVGSLLSGVALLTTGGQDDGDAGICGNAGNIAANSISCFNIYGNGGYGSGLQYAGGNGAVVTCYNRMNVENVYLSGGDSLEFSGGLAGSLFVDSDLQADGSIFIEGGSCTAVSNVYAARNGGNLYVKGNMVVSSGVNLSAGTRDGATTVANNLVGAQGGNLDVQGNLNIPYGAVITNGTTVSTFFPWGSGGNGGTIVVRGMCISQNGIFANGGDSAGRAGGSGGQLTVYGQTTNFSLSIELTGGDSVIAGSGAPASIPGSGGAATFAGGCVIDTFTAVNGAGTGAAPFVRTLNLGGSCSFNSLDMPTLGLIKAYDGTQNVVLKVNTMPTKTTFNNAAGTATASQAANLANNLFFSGASGNWYRLAATAGPL